VSAENAGLLQVDYESMEWAQGNNDWTTGWNLSVNTGTVWRINVTNNDPDDAFYIGDNTALILSRATTGSTDVFSLVDSASTNTPAVTAYTDLSQSISPGGEHRIYFGATIKGGDTVAKSPAQKDMYIAPIVMFGEMCSGGGCPGSGTEYGQTIPFLGILLE
jgi:hypothetical protein